MVAAVMSCMVIAGSQTEATLTCDQVTVWLTPCMSYAVMGGNISSFCCQGVHSLIAAKRTTEDRILACQCIKDKAVYIPGIDYNRVNAIPGKCGTQCPYKVYPSTHCSKVQ